MVDPLTIARLLHRAAYILLSLLAVFFYILPLDVGTGRWPGPDLLVALTFAWGVRRPDYVPALLVAAVMLMADLIFLRPPGLWAALTVLGLEFLRRRTAQNQEMSFALEWMLVTGTLALMVLANRLLLGLTMTPQTSLGLTLLQLFSTVMAYPVIAFVSASFGRITRPEGDEPARVLR
ncbi:hypothetical protein AQS8620_01148 [Aquimixticola soesokkakensis]|uniref:Rod shape-determining protein MreD n=1 Tax=Aquimixticola soesokkakensis TaxID=1519096 RepID=A0A1Y5S8E1_9RHOB|nr:rod shape-determining protein MreD [Aquimixticola soesokkakensis]SLN33471.1 hypothetical protein AQS8620_01148 [Aquimixticola soesokkakensis]